MMRTEIKMDYVFGNESFGRQLFEQNYKSDIK